MAQQEREVGAQELLALYRNRMRPFLSEEHVTGIDSLDRQAELLEQALTRPTEVQIGFVGEAQVGKSTLINAILDRTALPSGGIGPLTARATSVTHADQDRMTVKFHGKQAIGRLIFGLTRYLEIRGEIPKGSVAPAPDSEDDPDVSAVVTEGSPDDAKADLLSSGSKAKFDYMVSQVRRLLGADATGGATKSESNRVLLQAIAAVVGRELKLEPPASIVPYQQHITEIMQRIGTEQELTSQELGGPEAFDRELRLRAAGWLSPMVSELRVGLASEVVNGLTLVDLPGTGAVGDPAAQAAKEFVERQGHSLVIVSRNAGLMEGVADLLESTGVVTRLLFGGRDGAVPIHLLLAVTHLDDVARDRFREAKRAAQANGGSVPDRHQIFRDLSKEMETVLRGQIRDALKASQAFEDLSGELRTSREMVVERLVEDIDIVCVAAPDYLDVITNPNDNSAFLTDPNTTGIPRFRSAIQALARNAKARRLKDILTQDRQLRKDLRVHLGSLQGLYAAGKGTAQEEWERFRAELQERVVPLREEMQAHHGDVLSTLRRGLLERIKSLCQTAETHGLKRLDRLTSHGATQPYQSVLAALRRDGVWNRRNINYPANLSAALLDIIASQWEPEIVDAVKEEIRRLAALDLSLVQQLVDIATALDERLVAKSQIETQKKILQQGARSAVAWTADQLEALRGRVQEKLSEAIEPPIARACKEALRSSHRYTGTGGRAKILEIFKEGSTEALEEARKAAEAVLRTQYQGLLRKLDEGYLKDHHDPLEVAFDSLTDKVGRRAQKEDGRRRAAILGTVDEFSAALSMVGDLDAALLEAV